MALIVPVKLVHEGGVIPRYQSVGASGMDLHLCTDETILRIPGQAVRLVWTGLTLEIPHGYEGQIRSRSGLAKKGVIVANSPGTIDSDYRGEIGVLLYNTNVNPFHFEPRDRIAQIVFAPIAHVKLVEGEVSETRRGAKGFGSTGTGE